MFGFHADQLKVLLRRFDNDDCCLPKGYLRKNEMISDAASRVLQETAGIGDVFLQQFQTFRSRTTSQSPGETTNESIISIGYYALVDFESVVPTLSTSCEWCEIAQIPELLFDHNDMIEMALVSLKKDLRYLPIAKLLPQKFTLREMQKLYETILGRTFDRRNFHKLLMGYDFLIKLPEKKTGTANKSPHLYQIDFEKYESALQDGISY
jgi:8-oxo-dGTP diphosphatase